MAGEKIKLINRYELSLACIICSHFRVLQSASNNLDTSVREITRADPRFFKVAKTGTGNTYFESLLYRGKKIRMQYGVESVKNECILISKNYKAKDIFIIVKEHNYSNSDLND